MGWRYAYYTLGALVSASSTDSVLELILTESPLLLAAQMIFLWAIRFFVFPMDESPKFLVSIGKDHKAVEVIHRIARKNGTTSSLTVQDLRDAAAPYLDGTTPEGDGELETKFSTWELVKNSFADINGEHTKGLFATPRLAYSTGLIIFIYGALGLAYPLYKCVLFPLHWC